jgi:hypothetical protein
MALILHTRPSVSIEMLGKVGMETIGDCREFFEQAGNATISLPNGFLDVFYNQVVPHLKSLGYL